MVCLLCRCAVVLRDLISPYLLRRRKADVATQLPKKTETVLFCSLTETQRDLYRSAWGALMRACAVRQGCCCGDGLVAWVRACGVKVRWHLVEKCNGITGEESAQPLPVHVVLLVLCL